MILPQEIKVAVIGAGYMAQEHIKVFSSIDGVTVVGIHSRTKDKAQSVAAQFDIPFVAETILDLYENTKADLVLSASSLSFPHRMFKILLMEQIFRASSIIKNHPYHR